MTDSDTRDRLDAKHERNRQRRLDAVRRWAEYIESEPPEVWGPQQNAIVNGQLEAARAADLSAAHRQRVSEVASEILEVTETDGDGE